MIFTEIRQDQLQPFVFLKRGLGEVFLPLGEVVAGVARVTLVNVEIPCDNHQVFRSVLFSIQALDHELSQALELVNASLHCCCLRE